MQRTAGQLALLLCVAAASMVSPSLASADELIATVAKPAPVSQHGGRTIWSAFDPAAGTYSLVTSAGGGVSTVPVRTRTVPFDVDLGPGPSGATVAAYSRCRREPLPRDPRTGNALTRMPQWSSGRGCDLYRYDFASGRERRIAASSRHASEFLPTIWKGRVAFARVYERAGSSGRAYLYAGSLTARKRSIRLPAGPRARGRFCGPKGCARLLEAGPTALDLAGLRLAFGWDSYRDGPTTAVYLDSVRRHGAVRTRLSRGASGEIQAEEMLSPTIDGGWVSWGLARFGDETSSQLLRYRITTGARERAAIATPSVSDPFLRPLLWVSVRAGVALYLVSGASGEPGCTPQSPCVGEPGCETSCELRRASVFGASRALR